MTFISQETFTNVLIIHVHSDTAYKQLQENLENVGTILACIGNRQPMMPRYMDIGMEHIIKAMQANGVQRIVVISSMGIGDDYLSLGGMKVFWGAFLRTVIRSAYRDLQRMEHKLVNSNLDYVIVRPVGIPPEKEETETWVLFRSREEANKENYDVTMAKADVASYMLQEALEPTLHRVAVTIAGKSS